MSDSEYAAENHTVQCKQVVNMAVWSTSYLLIKDDTNYSPIGNGG